jgi:hypothetical protein
MIPVLTTQAFAFGGAGDLFPPVSLFVRDDFWHKLRALFIYDARVQVPGERQAP